MNVTSDPGMIDCSYTGLWNPYIIPLPVNILQIYHLSIYLFKGAYISENIAERKKKQSIYESFCIFIKYLQN